MARRSGRTRAAVSAAVIAASVAGSIATVKHFEGRELRAYRDVVGVWTICYGETLNVQPGDTATTEECDRRLADRLYHFSAAISRCLPRDLPVEMRAAFTSTAYNIGINAFCRSSMSRRAMAGDLRGACDALLMWDKGRVNGVLQRIRGLTRRRQAERELCLRG